MTSFQLSIVAQMIIPRRNNSLRVLRKLLGGNVGLCRAISSLAFGILDLGHGGFERTPL